MKKKIRVFTSLVVFVFTIFISMSLVVNGSDVNSLIQIIKNPKATVDQKGDACVQLMEIGPSAKPAVPALIDLLKSKDEILRDYAITTLDGLGSNAKAALPKLRELSVKDPSEFIREIARDAVKNIGGASKAVSPTPTPFVSKKPSAKATPAPTVKKTAKTTPKPGVKNLNRPVLLNKQGTYFAYSIPKGWRSSETTNGVSLYSSDNKQYVASCLLLRSMGSTTPSEFVMAVIKQIPGWTDAKLVKTKELPDQPSGIPGTKWTVAECELTYKVNGVEVRGSWTCGVNNYYGMYDVNWLGFHATTDKWEEATLYLPEIAHSIKITNFRDVAGNNTLMTVKNHPLDNSAIIDSYNNKSKTDDRLSQQRSDTILEYDRLKDPTTNQIYEMPYEAYDASAGGYRSPDDSQRLLVETEPGE